MKRLLKILVSMSVFSTSFSTVSCDNLPQELSNGVNNEMVSLSEQNLDFTQISNLLENNILDGKDLTFSNTIADGVKLIQSIVGNRFFVRLVNFNLAQNLINNTEISINIMLTDPSNQASSKTILVKIARISNPRNVSPSLTEQNNALSIETYVKSVYPNLTISDPSWIASTLTAATVIAKINLTLGSGVVVEQTSDLIRTLTTTTTNISLPVLIKEVENQNNSVSFTFNILIDSALIPPTDATQPFFNYFANFFHIAPNSTMDNINIDWDGSQYTMGVTAIADIVSELSPKLPQDLIVYYNGNEQVLNNNSNVYNSNIKLDFVFKDLNAIEHIVHFSINNIKLNLANIKGIIEREIQDDAISQFQLGQKEDEIANYIQSKMVGGSLNVTAPQHGVLSDGGWFSGNAHIELNISQKGNPSNALNNTSLTFPVKIPPILDVNNLSTSIVDWQNIDNLLGYNNSSWYEWMNHYGMQPTPGFTDILVMKQIVDSMFASKGSRLRTANLTKPIWSGSYLTFKVSFYDTLLNDTFVTTQYVFTAQFRW